MCEVPGTWRVKTPSARPSWHHYYLAIARTAATRSTCARLHVGAVLVKDRAICATGYNGAPSGAPHCDDVGHLMVDGHCVRSVHGESNAIVQAARNGTSVDGATLYVTHRPCWDCLKLVTNAGVTSIFYGEEYGPEYPVDVRGTGPSLCLLEAE